MHPPSYLHDGCIAKGRDGSKVFGAEEGEQGGKARGRYRGDDVASREFPRLTSLGEAHRPSSALLWVELCARSGEGEVLPSDGFGERFGEGRQSTTTGEDFFGDGSGFGVLRRSSLRQSTTDEAPMLLLQRIELGEGIASDEAVWIARIDPADEGVDGVVEEAPALTGSTEMTRSYILSARSGSRRT